MNRLVAVVLVLGTLGCASPTVDPEELLAADRRFQQATAERGARGWVDAFARDGKLIAGGSVIEGHEAIAEVMAVLDSAEYSLTWEPELAEGSGNLGYTVGSYRREVTDADGATIVETGRYVTVWRRDDDGVWRAVVDVGSPAS